MFSLLTLLACNEQNLARRTVTDEFEQAPSNAVDILWVIDNSVSMANEQENVAAGAEDFIANLEESELDFHVGVISTDVSFENPNAGVLLGNPPYLTSDCRSDGDPSDCTYADAFKDRVVMGTTGSDQEKGLQAAIAALTSPMSESRNGGFLRSEALLSIIIVSDENDCSDMGALGSDASGEECYTEAEKLSPITDLVRMIKDVKADTGSGVVLSGIVGPDVVEGCDQTVPGKRYYGAINLLGGVQEDICQTDYSMVMDALGQISAGILTIFQLSYAAVEDTIEITVTLPDGTETVPQKSDTNGWTYLADYAQIEFHGDAIPARGSSVVIKYEVAGNVPENTDTGM